MLRCFISICLLLADLEGLLANEFCMGGQSLRGLTELSSKHHYHDYGTSNITTVSCCDETVCHGGLTLKNEHVGTSFIINNKNPFSNFDLQQQYAQQLLQSNDRDAAAAQRHKR